MFGPLVPWRKRSLVPANDRFARLMDRMEEEMEDLYGRFGMMEGGWMPETFFTPTTDVAETEREYEVTVDLPGLKPEEVKVELKNGDLWIEGKHSEEKEEEGKTFHRVERRRGEFRRVLPLPTAIDRNKITAAYDNGVLKVHVPKMEEAKPTPIEVKA